MRFDKIVIEGPNNVGKSTLIKAIQKMFPEYEVEHVTEKCPNTYSFYNSLLSTEEPMIFDRLHLGEMVYPGLFERESNLTGKEFEELCRNHGNHTLIVLLDADYDFIIRACENKNEYFDFPLVEEEKFRFYELGQQMMNMKCSNLNFIKLKNHWDEETKSIIVGKVVGAICG